MKKLTNKNKLSATLLSLSIFPLFSMFILQYIKWMKHRDSVIIKTSSSDSTKILSLEGISEPITIYELNKVLNPGGFKMTAHPDHFGNKNYTIEYKAPFGGVYCEKKFVFTNDCRVKLCNYALYGFDAPSEPQKIYEEISDFNGVPDTIYFDKEIFFLQCTWYGKNGYIVYDYFRRGTIAAVFKLYTQ